MALRKLGTRDLHVVSRFSHGYSAPLGREVATFKTVDRWLDKQFTVPRGLTSPTIDAWFPRLTRDSPTTAQANSDAGTRGAWDYGQDLIAWTLARRLASGNQVHEVLVDFWSNLLHIPVSEDYSWPWRFDYDRTIRRYALTSYRQLLTATMMHPAMTGYMTNFDNLSWAINENLGREVMELYSVGVDAGYTESDVKKSALLLTGFTLDVGDSWRAGYDVGHHYTGRVTVMGRTFANPSDDGRQTVRQYLEFLALHPKTAHRIAYRLCQRFVCDAPRPSIVNAVAKTYTRTRSDIVACLRTLVAHPEFMAWVGRKARNPVEDLVASMRAVQQVPKARGSSSGLDSLSWCCANAGLQPFTWPAPNGFPEASAIYAAPSRMLRSWTMHTWMVQPGDAWTDFTVPAAKSWHPTSFPLTVAELAHQQSVLLTGHTADPDVVTAFAAYLGRPATDRLTADDVSDWTLSLARTTILNSPGAMLR